MNGAFHSVLFLVPVSENYENLFFKGRKQRCSQMNSECIFDTFIFQGQFDQVTSLLSLKY